MPADNLVASEGALAALERAGGPDRRLWLPIPKRQRPGESLMMGLSQTVTAFARRELARAHGLSDP